MRELSDLLPDLKPPPGGLARLQQRIARPPHAAHRPWRLGLGTLALGMLALALILPGLIARQRESASLRDALRQTLAPSIPDQGIRVMHGAALELPSTQPDVRIYLVQADAATSADSESKP